LLNVDLYRVTFENSKGGPGHGVVVKHAVGIPVETLPQVVSGVQVGCGIDIAIVTRTRRRVLVEKTIENDEITGFFDKWSALSVNFSPIG